MQKQVKVEMDATSGSSLRIGQSTYDASRRYKMPKTKAGGVPPRQVQPCTVQITVSVECVHIQDGVYMFALAHFEGLTVLVA